MKVNIRKITYEEIEMPVHDVLMQMLKEVRVFSDEVILYKNSKRHSGYIESFAKIAPELLAKKDLSALCELDMYNATEKEEVCNILCKYENILFKNVELTL